MRGEPRPGRGAPRVAVVDEDPSRLREMVELLEHSGYAPHAFASPRSASQVAVAIGVDVMVIDHGIREVPLRDLQRGLEERLGATAPQIVVVSRQLHDMPIPERASYVAVLPRPIDVDTLVSALESAAARYARAAVLEGRAEGHASPAPSRSLD